MRVMRVKIINCPDYPEWEGKIVETYYRFSNGINFIDQKRGMIFVKKGDYKRVERTFICDKCGKEFDWPIFIDECTGMYGEVPYIETFAYSPCCKDNFEEKFEEVEGDIEEVDDNEEEEEDTL